MNKNDLTPEESLAIISRAISNFRVNYKENSVVYLLWGWVFIIASILSFLIIRYLPETNLSSYVGVFMLCNWVIACAAGFVLLYFAMRKINKQKLLQSHIDIYMKYLWSSAAIAFVVGSFICLRTGIAPPAIMLLIAGIATATSGFMLKFKPLIIGGFLFFIFSIASTFVNDEFVSLLMAASMICGYLIPGYLLKFAGKE